MTEVQKNTLAKWVIIVCGSMLVVFFAKLGYDVVTYEYPKAQLMMNYSHAGYHVTERSKTKTMDECLALKAKFEKVKNHPVVAERPDDFEWFANRTFVCEEL